MSDNVGLSTPRGSGTSGYVQRNLAHFRPRDMAAPYAPRDTDSLRHQPRKPDQGLLEHDRKREVEVKVFELRDRLEEEGVDEEVIETRCDELRKKLLADSLNRSSAGGGGPVRRNFKAHQVHELADAKLKESERLRQALKISKSYEEGTHWRKQEERSKMALERGNEDASGAGAGGGPSNVKRERDEGRRDIRDRGRRRDMDRGGGRSRSRRRSVSRSRSRSRSVPRAKAWDDGGDRDRPRMGVRDRDRDRDRDREGDRERYRERDRGDKDRYRERSEERGRDRDDGSDQSSNPKRSLSPERSRSRDSRDRYRD